jgi:hypothetical protein
MGNLWSTRALASSDEKITQLRSQIDDAFKSKNYDEISQISKQIIQFADERKGLNASATISRSRSTGNSQEIRNYVP